jgi:hypothetical protein
VGEGRRNAVFRDDEMFFESVRESIPVARDDGASRNREARDAAGAGFVTAEDPDNTGTGARRARPHVERSGAVAPVSVRPRFPKPASVVVSRRERVPLQLVS